MAKHEFSFSYPFRIRYSEIDGQGVVFNAHYLTFFDTAITEYFRQLPFDYQGQLEKTGNDFHTVRTVVDYKAPVLFDEDIEVFVRAARIGRSSLSLALEIYAKDSDQLRNSGEVVWVNTDQSSGKSVPLPVDLIDLLRAREGDSLDLG
ncbi:MAG: thioesterase family protein [Oceanicoccus sp.]